MSKQTLIHKFGKWVKGPLHIFCVNFIHFITAVFDPTHRCQVQTSSCPLQCQQLQPHSQHLHQGLSPTHLPKTPIQVLWNNRSAVHIQYSTHDTSLTGILQKYTVHFTQELITTAHSTPRSKRYITKANSTHHITHFSQTHITIFAVWHTYPYHIAHDTRHPGPYNCSTQHTSLKSL